MNILLEAQLIVDNIPHGVASALREADEYINDNTIATNKQVCDKMDSIYNKITIFEEKIMFLDYLKKLLKGYDYLYEQNNNIF